MINNQISLESFINFCDDMYIEPANEGLKEVGNKILDAIDKLITKIRIWINNMKSNSKLTYGDGVALVPNKALVLHQKLMSMIKSESSADDITSSNEYNVFMTMQKPNIIRILEDEDATGIDTDLKPINVDKIFQTMNKILSDAQKYRSHIRSAPNDDDTNENWREPLKKLNIRYNVNAKLASLVNSKGKFIKDGLKEYVKSGQLKRDIKDIKTSQNR